MYNTTLGCKDPILQGSSARQWGTYIYVEEFYLKNKCHYCAEDRESLFLKSIIYQRDNPFTTNKT